MLFVPDDLISYADTEYYEHTPEVAALERFISSRLVKPAIAKDISDTEYKTTITHDLVCEIFDIIKDFNIMPTAGFQKSLDLLSKMLDKGIDEKGFHDLADVYFTLSNNTRMPMNKGYTPHELSATRSSIPTSIQFGPGITSAIQSGDLDADELRQSVFAQSDLPMGIRSSFLSEIDKAELVPGEERWIGGTVVKAKKVGPNDPCPCGSGKKYKKCCGR